MQPSQRVNTMDYIIEWIGNEWMENKRANNWMTELVKRWMYGWMNMNKHMNEWMKEWTNENWLNKKNEQTIILSRELTNERAKTNDVQRNIGAFTWKRGWVSINIRKWNDGWMSSW